MLILLLAATGTALATGLGAIPVFLLGTRAAVLQPLLLGITQERLDEVAAKLNRRPRKTLEFRTPAEKLTELIDGLAER